MADIFNGRFTADMQGDFVVFLIGMCVNKLRVFRKWARVVQAMGPMLSTLYQHPEKGFLGGQTFFSLRTIKLVQYWRSVEDLERFARNSSDPHLPAWRKFNQAVGIDGSVGIFHETCRVRAGGYECVYDHMPRFGLAAVSAHVPAIGRRETMRRRLGGERNDAVTLKHWFARLGRVLPNLRLDVTDIWVKGWPSDLTAIARWNATATLADGSPYRNHGVHVIRLKRGKVHSFDVVEASQAVAYALRVQRPMASAKPRLRPS